MQSSTDVFNPNLLAFHLTRWSSENGLLHHVRKPGCQMCGCPHSRHGHMSAALSSSRVEEGWPGAWRYLDLVPEFQMVEVWWDEFHLYDLIRFGVPSRIFNNNTMVIQRKIKIIITFHSDHSPLVKLAKGRGSAVFEQTSLNQTIPA